MQSAETFEVLIEQVYAAATNLESHNHGPAHWRRVAEVGWHLCDADPKADRDVVLCFALCHDACRVNNVGDPLHGERAAGLVARLHADGALALDDGQADALARACARHHHADVSGDATIGACFDADRLTLWRVGITPDPALLSTRVGRTRLLTLGRALESAVPIEWPALLAAYERRRLPPSRPVA